MCATITSESTCAQGKSRYFPLEPRIKPQTLWQRHYHKTHSSDIASPCVDSNPRCPSKGVWDILYYGTYVPAVFLEGENLLLRFWAKIASPRFLAVSLLWFHMTQSLMYRFAGTTPREAFNHQISVIQLIVIYFQRSPFSNAISSPVS